MQGEKEPEVPIAPPKPRDTYTAQFAVRDGKPVTDEPLDAQFQERYETQTDFEWRRVFPEPFSAEALSLFRSGNQAFREDRILDAIDAYQAALALEDYGPARLNLAVALLHEASPECWTRCRALLDQVIARYQTQYEGQAPAEREGLSKAEIGSVLAPAYRNLAELLTQMAVLSADRANLEHAASYTEMALAIQPENTAWRLELWGILHLLDRAEEATDALLLAGKADDFEPLSLHMREKYTALKVRYHTS